MVYEVQLSTDAADFLLSQTKKIKRQIGKKLKSLSTDPRPNGHIKLKAKENLYRIRSGDYRIVYQIQDKRVLVLVLRIAHRRQVYKNIK